MRKKKTVKANVNSTVIETTACIQIRRAKSRETATVCVVDTKKKKKRKATQKKRGEDEGLLIKKKKSEGKATQRTAILLRSASQE